MKSALIAFSLLLASAAHAIEIETTYWGDVWQRRGSMPSAVLPGETPGSGSNDTLRVAKPWAWAFLDGYDVRAAKCLDLAPVLSHTNISYRMTWLSPFFARRDLLRKLWCGENHDVYWGGSVLDDHLALTSYPAEEGFEWSENPTTNVWNNGGSAWLPTYRSLFPSVAFPLEYTPVFGGLAAKLFDFVDVNEQVTNSFSAYISDDYSSHDIAGRKYATPFSFNAVITNAALFSQSTNVVTNLAAVASRTTARLDYDTVAIPIQTLACLDRLYRFAPDLVAVTNCAFGDAKATYNLRRIHPITVSTHDHGATVTVDGYYSAYEFVSETNDFSVATNACAFYAPRTRTTAVSVSAGGYGSATNSFGYIFFPSGGEYDPNDRILMSGIRRGGPGKYYLQLDLYGGATLCKWTDDTEDAEEITNVTYRVENLCKNGDFGVRPEVGVVFGFEFEQADEIALQSPPSVRWRWPSNTTCHADGDWCAAAFASSYCTITNDSRFFNVDINSDIHYDTTEYYTGLWNLHGPYGYRFSRHEYDSPADYPDKLEGRLSELKTTSRNFIGGDLTDEDRAFQFVGASRSDAIAFANSSIGGASSWIGISGISTAESNRLVVASVTTNFPYVLTNIYVGSYAAYHGVTNSTISYVESNELYHIVHKASGWRIVRELEYCEAYTNDWQSDERDVQSSYTNIVITANGNVVYIQTNAIASATNVTKTVAHWDPYYPEGELPDIAIGTLTTNVVGGVTNVVYRFGDTDPITVLTNGVPAEGYEGWSDTAYYLYDAISTNVFTEITRTASSVSHGNPDDWRKYITVTTNGEHTVTDLRAYFTATVEGEAVALDPPEMFLFAGGLSVGIDNFTNDTPWRTGKYIDTRVKALQSANFLFPQNHRN